MRWKRLSRLRSSARRWWKVTRARSGFCSTTSTSSSTSSRSTPAIFTASIASGAAPRDTNFRTWRRGGSLDPPAAWRNAANNLIATLFEPPCAACKKPLLHPLNGAVCEDCWRDLRLAPPLLDRLRADQGVDWACAVDRYDGRMKEIIHALKYERRRSIAAPLGALMRATGARVLQDADLVVPVPLHPRREYQRGFNQAEDLARHLGLPLAPLLKRVVHTQSQIELPKDQRRANVTGAFEFSPDPRSPIPDPRIVVLVDDVATTGSTLDACARVLKSAGVKEVRAITAARVVSEPR